MTERKEESRPAERLTRKNASVRQSKGWALQLSGRSDVWGEEKGEG